MDQDKLRKLLTNDGYIALAFNRYQRFKQSNTYDEQYKYDILSDLNEYFTGLEITEDNVVEVVKYVEKANPSKGFFAFWTDLSDLNEYANEKPEEVARLLNNLYFNNNDSIEQRINHFRQTGKAHNSKIRLGGALFGYLLAAYNYNQYPIYKDGVLDYIKESFNINVKSGLVSENYQFYYDILQVVHDYFQEQGYSLTILDVQDFFFCLTSYDKLKVESAVDFIYKEAVDLAAFSKDDEKFLAKIHKCNRDVLNDLRKRYQQGTKVNKIRYQLIDQILNGETVNLEQFEQIKNEISEENEKNILRNWNNFKILFQFHYQPIQRKVEFELANIHKAISDLEHFEDHEFVEGDVINGFNWNRNLGGSSTWVAVYPNSKVSHKEAAQLYLAIDKEGVKYGVLHGTEHPQHGERDIETDTDLTKFTFEKMKEKYESVYPRFIQDNEVDFDGELSSDFDNVFDSVEQAEWVFNFASQSLSELGIESPGNPKAAVSFPSKKKFHVDFGRWLIFSTTRDRNKSIQVAVALLYKDVKDTNYKTELFTQYDEKAQVALTYLPFEDFKSNEDLHESHHQALQVALSEFKNYNKSPYRKSNNPTLESAVFDQNLRKKVLVEGLNDEEPEVTENIVEIPTIDFKQELTVNNLYFENKELILKQVKTALENGKHIILTGPPGTGKSKLAKAICNSYGAQFKMKTATSDWFTYETMGGYRPNIDGTLSFQPGLFLNCFKDGQTNQPINKWLIIDEMNRADIDKAFGSLFSALTGDSIELNFQSDSARQINLLPQEDETSVVPNDYEYMIPNDWRLIGTMNTLDKASLYEMSYAFMRRFAFIPVGVPKDINDEMVELYLNKWGVTNYSYTSVLTFIWQQINDIRQIGPAIVEDIAKYTAIDGDFTSAIILYVLPQFEGLLDQDILEFINRISQVDQINEDELKSFAEDFFHVKV
ncbi:MoxR family ATPase [Alkalibacillus silvisoli]|uniref:AAA+ ATPase domain-containing protein n=1 Tax=Alkalibacillus silvisoli TaxID=392823 RepID=A0ABN0ZNH4_9BACI